MDATWSQLRFRLLTVKVSGTNGVSMSFTRPHEWLCPEQRSERASVHGFIKKKNNRSMKVSVIIDIKWSDMKFSDGWWGISELTLIFASALSSCHLNRLTFHECWKTWMLFLACQSFATKAAAERPNQKEKLLWWCRMEKMWWGLAASRVLLLQNQQKYRTFFIHKALSHNHGWSKHEEHY